MLIGHPSVSAERQSFPGIVKVIWSSAEIDQIHRFDFPDLKELIIKRVDLVLVSVLNHLPLESLTVIDSRVNLEIPNEPSRLISLDLSATTILHPDSLSRDLVKYPSLKSLFLNTKITQPFWHGIYEKMPSSFLPELETLHMPGILMKDIPPHGLLYLRSLQVLLTAASNTTPRFHLRPFDSFIRHLHNAPANSPAYHVGRVERNKRSYDNIVINEITDTPIEPEYPEQMVETIEGMPTDSNSMDSRGDVSPPGKQVLATPSCSSKPPARRGERIWPEDYQSNTHRLPTGTAPRLIKSDKIIPITVSLSVSEEDWRKARAKPAEIQAYVNSIQRRQWSISGIHHISYPQLGQVDPGLARILAVEKVHHFFLMTPYEIYSFFSGYESWRNHAWHVVDGHAISSQSLIRGQELPKQQSPDYIKRLCERKDYYMYCHTNDLGEHSSMESIYYFFASCCRVAVPGLENPVLSSLKTLITVMSATELPLIPPELFQYIGGFLV